MNHLTWDIPAERQRSRGAQALDDLWFTLVLIWEWLVGPFKRAPAPLTDNVRAGALPVIIVPGFICRPSIYRSLQVAIHATGHPAHVLNLGFQLGSIEGKARELSAYIDRIGADEVIVVGHSMGGLILSRSLQLGEKRVKRSLTLGTPLTGTHAVYGVYALVLWGLVSSFQASGAWPLWALVFAIPALWQMRPGSTFLKGLGEIYPKLTNTTSVFCAQDLVAFHNPLEEPGTATRFGRESDVLFPEAGHNNLVMGKNACAAIARAVATL